MTYTTTEEAAAALTGMDGKVHCAYFANLTSFNTSSDHKTSCSYMLVCFAEVQCVQAEQPDRVYQCVFFRNDLSLKRNHRLFSESENVTIVLKLWSDELMALHML